mgnify:CR=1 FL=1
MISYGKERFDLVLQTDIWERQSRYTPEKYLRIIQVEGEQCVDFNAFNLHDYKERMDVGSSRGSTGFRPKKGDILSFQSAQIPSHDRYSEMSPTCQTDVLGRTCHATVFEMSFGLERHTNCQDTIAEAISEYGLTPDDAHDSFNMWMNSEWDSTGKTFTMANTGRKGDFVESGRVL